MATGEPTESTAVREAPDGQRPGRRYDYAIIGMGIGGLALGALLAQAGRRVLICERHYLPGGYAQTFRIGKYSFCAELHYVWDCGPGQRVTRFLHKLGLDEQVRFHQLDPNGFDRVIAPGVDYTIGNGFDRECHRLAALFPGHERGLREYFSIVDTIYQQGYALPIDHSFGEIAAHPLKFSHVLRYARWTLQELFDHLQFPASLRLILAGQSAIFFLPPKQLSLLAHAAGVGSYNSGAYVPQRSYAHVIKALYGKIRRQPGCRAMLRTEVRKLHVAGGRVVAMTTARDETFEADCFLFDGDAQLSVDLIGRQHFPEEFRRRLDYEYSTSALSVYLGLEGLDLRRCGLGEENIFWHPSVDLNAVYDEQFAARIPEQPYFFCDAPTTRMTDPALAPPGGHQLVMVAPCSYEFFRHLRAGSEEAYQQAKQEYAARIIRIVEREFVPNLSRHIATRVVGSPLTNEFFVTAPRGNCYGTPLDTRHVHLERLNYRSPFDNFHYIGASASLPGFASLIHFACLLYEKLAGDRVYDG